MIESGSGPCRRVVAGLARGREELRLRRVAWVGRVVVVRLVTADASRGQSRVVIVDVAVAALSRRHGMRASQRKRSVVVIERGVGPDARVMTDLAGGGETRRSMRRIVGAGVILLMARIAQNAVQGIVVVDMAISTQPRRHRVSTGQRKTGGRMVELAVGPEHGIVAGLACGRQSRRNVVHRRGRAVVIPLVARQASRRCDVVIVVDVAIAALPRWHGVIAGQGEAGAVVVERRIQPRRGAVT